MDEKERRKRLASLPFSEKLKILEKLRDRSRAIAGGGLRKTMGRSVSQHQTTGRPIRDFIPFRVTHSNFFPTTNKTAAATSD